MDGIGVLFSNGEVFVMERRQDCPCVSSHMMGIQSQYEDDIDNMFSMDKVALSKSFQEVIQEVIMEVGFSPAEYSTCDVYVWIAEPIKNDDCVDAWDGMEGGLFFEIE